jgi:predicted transcriptional regulator
MCYVASTRPGPDDPHWKIPLSEWPNVLRRVEQGEPLRKVADEYGISHQTVRCVIRAARKQRMG